MMRVYYRKLFGGTEYCYQLDLILSTSLLNASTQHKVNFKAKYSWFEF